MESAGAHKRAFSSQYHQRKKPNPHLRERTVTELVPSIPDGGNLVISPSEQSPSAFGHLFSPNGHQPNMAASSSFPTPSPDLEILERLKEQIKSGNHESFVPVPQPAALAGLYLGPDDSHKTAQLPAKPPPQDPRGNEYRPDRPDILEPADRRNDRYVPSDEREREFNRDYHHHHHQAPREYDFRPRTEYEERRGNPVNHPGLPPLASGGDRYYPAGERERERELRERERDYRYSRHDDSQFRPRSYSDGRNGSVPPTLDTRLGSSLSISRPRDDRPAPVQSEVALRALEKRQQAAATASSKPLEERISDRPTPSLQERIAAVPMPSTLSPPHPTNGSSNQPELSVKTEPEDTKMKTPPVQPPSPTGSSRDTKRSSSVHSSPSKSNPSLEARLSSALPSGTTRPRSTSRTRPDDGRPMSYNRDPRDRARVPPPGTGDRYVPPYDTRPDAFRSSYRPPAQERAAPPHSARVVYDERDRERAAYARDARDYVPRDDIRVRDYAPRDDRDRDPLPRPAADRTTTTQPRFRETREPAPDWQYDLDSRTQHDLYTRPQPPPPSSYERERYAPPPAHHAYDRARERSPVRGNAYERPLSSRITDLPPPGRRDDYPPPPPRRDDYTRAPDYATPRYADSYSAGTGTRRGRSPSPLDPRDDRPPLKRTRDDRGDRYYSNDPPARNDGYYNSPLPRSGGSPAPYDSRNSGRAGESYRPVPVEYPPPPARDYGRDPRDPYAPPHRPDDRDRDRVSYAPYGSVPRERSYSNGYDSRRSPAPPYDPRTASRAYDTRRY